jgi:2-iminobutanoate/2-iminopropanoate deaminase
MEALSKAKSAAVAKAHWSLDSDALHVTWENNMKSCLVTLFAVCLGFCGPVAAQQTTPTASPLEYMGKPVRGVPVSQAVKAGTMLFVSGMPPFGQGGKIAVGDFPAQMKQVMENLTGVLKSSGVGWDRVVKTTVYLTRFQDFAEMNRIYALYFPSGNYPSRTTVVVSALPHPDFLLEIECEAVLE